MPPIRVDDTLGAAWIGFSISCIILGLLFKELFTYFGRYPNDKIGYKLLVSIVGILEITEEVIIGHFLYHYLVSNFANPKALFFDDFVWSLVAPVCIGTTVGAIVKCCFALRVWRFSNKNIFITGSIVFLTLTQLGLGITFTIKSYGLKQITRAEELKLVATLALGSGALTDTITAGTLCYYLRKFRTGYKESDHLVYKLSLYAINTGALTSVMSLCALTFYDLHPRTFLFMPFYFTLSRLYAVSLMCTLNTRRVTHGYGTDRDANSAQPSLPLHSGHLHQSRYSSNNAHLHPSPSSPTMSQLEVEIHHEVSVVRDDDSEALGYDHLDLPKGLPSPPSPPRPAACRYN